MQLLLSNVQLGDILADIAEGAPLWGMLKINEYSELDSVLRKIIVGKAQRGISNNSKYALLQEVVQAVSRGSRLKDLPLEMQRQIKVVEQLRRRTKVSYFPHHRESHFWRKSKLQSLMAA